jgi:tRNA pseudouridine55 synthase
MAEREAPTAASIAGILNVDKPAGWTSADVVAFIRRGTKTKRVGHAGTLDPAATGVLPVLLGRATRLAEYLVDATKTYLATVQLGLETDTFDLDGEVVSRADSSRVTLTELETALTAFRGEFEQMPPAFSAIKRNGVPMYKLARAGEAVTLEARRVRVERLQITSYEPPLLRLEIDCAKGFYVRSLAHDLGAALGVGGTLAGLVRSRVGTFRVEDAVDIETLRSEMASAAWQDRLYAPDEVLLSWQVAVLGETNRRRLAYGQTVLFEAISRVTEPRCRAYSGDGNFLAVLRREGEATWRPEKVMVAN